MIKWQKRQHLVIHPRQVPTFNRSQLHYITHDIPMRKHHSFGQTSGARGVDQKSQIVHRIHLLLPPPRCATYVPDASKMLEPATGILVIAHQSDHVSAQAHHLTRTQHGIQEWTLGDDGTGSGIFELECQFLSSVGGVCGTDDAAGPQRAERYSGSVDAVRGEEEEDLAFAP